MCWGRTGWLRYDEAATTALGGVPYLHAIRPAPRFSSADFCRFVDDDPVCWKTGESAPGRDPDASNITSRQGPPQPGAHCRPVGADQICWDRPEVPAGVRVWPSGAWRPFGVDGVLCRFIDFKAVCWNEGDELPAVDDNPAGVSIGPVGHGGAPCRVFAGHRICWEPPRDDLSPGDFLFVEEMPGAAPPDAADGDRAALIAFYDATNGRRWTEDTNWRTEAPIETWHGVTVDADGRVVSLALALGRNITEPTAFRELAALTKLSSLSLSITGTIPPELGNLTELRFLGIGGTGLSGVGVTA